MYIHNVGPIPNINVRLRGLDSGFMAGEAALWTSTFDFHTLSREPKGPKSADDIFKCMLLNEISCNLIQISYTLGRENRVMRNRYSRLLFTSEDRLSAKLRVRE